MERTQVLDDIFHVSKPIIGMVHLRALPGAPLYDPRRLSMGDIVEIAVEEALQLQDAGVDGLQIENIWDYPYLKGAQVGHETTAAMAVAACHVKNAVSIPIGINCHLNAGIQALAAAVATGAKWIRVFEWVNAYVSHAGFTEGIAGTLARYRAALKADDIKFFCDVGVKHGSHFIISDRSLADQAHDAETEGAEVLIVTGFETGKAPTPEKVRELAAHVTIPVLIGSGTTKENARQLLQHADGAIVGSYFKRDHKWQQAVDRDATREFMNIVKDFREGLR